MLAGTGPRGGAAGPGRPGERGLQLWRRPEGSGSGRRVAARGELPGRSGLGDCVLPLLQWAAVKRLAQSVCAAAPNFRLFLFWPEPRFPSLLAQPVTLQYTPSSRCCPAASRGLPHTQARLEGTGITPSVTPIIRSGTGETCRVGEGGVKFILKNFLTEFTLRESSLQRSRQDELSGIGGDFLKPVF